ncbi:MAG: PIN domain-containing protein [Nanoarchaeota archaeon]|nr:PIN domain-containing protein [Nanoarchaeota archaeon]MBU1445363.1 PIN domain-containing protein [Nanoarchaeota archaeon]MBU2420136.1 PIN domain-containing protein [Nanoarchaeota archaeon]MBU2475242.1 PIN domain-containing protein [Nanoarchaeota archaeon]MBU3941156.1 PIN domain-containing protein [Nanoarchaeota archaeon]
MAKTLFYLDSCIWLNFFKKEGDADKGIPYWKIAKDFIEKIIFSKEDEIIYSGFVLKELKFKLNEKEFKEKLLFFKNEERFKFVKATEEDYSFARKLESDLKYEISFFDCLHIAICKRLNLVLVTRDEDLIKFANKYIKVKKPEHLIN